MKRLNRFIRTLWRDQRGLTTVEYAVAGAVIAAVVIETLGFAFHELIEAFALLPIEGTLARLGQDQAILVALGVLAHFDAIAPHDNRAFGGHHLAGEHADLFQVIVLEQVGFDAHGLVAVGFFSERRTQPAQEQQAHQGQENQDSEGTKLADVVMPGIVRLAPPFRRASC